MVSLVSAGAEDPEDSGFPDIEARRSGRPARYAFARIPARSLSCYGFVMNPVLEDAIIALATTIGAWLFAQQVGAVLYG